MVASETCIALQKKLRKSQETDPWDDGVFTPYLGMVILVLTVNKCEGKTYQISMDLIMKTWAVGGLGWLAAGEFLELRTTSRGCSFCWLKHQNSIKTSEPKLGFV